VLAEGNPFPIHMIDAVHAKVLSGVSNQIPTLKPKINGFTSLEKLPFLPLGGSSGLQPTE
jgi:hypothetical protein